MVKTKRCRKDVVKVELTF